VIADKNGEPSILLQYLKPLRVKTQVRNYDDAQYQLLTVAERVRNYASYITNFRLPLHIDMVGKRKDNGQWFPFPALFDDEAHLPITDGGIRDDSIFTTRFGPPDGMKPPYEALGNLDTLGNWARDINEKLGLIQQLLDRIDMGTPLDVAIRSLGESIWAREATVKLTCCWRAVESVAGIDFKTTYIEPEMVFETIHKRSKHPIGSDQFERLKFLRNTSTHFLPTQEQSREIHQASYTMFLVAKDVVESAMKEIGFT